MFLKKKKINNSNNEMPEHGEICQMKSVQNMMYYTVMMILIHQVTMVGLVLYMNVVSNLILRSLAY